MLGLDYNTRFTDKEIDNWNLETKIRMAKLKNDTNKWFTDTWLVRKLYGLNYRYFGTFNFDKEWVKDKTFEDLQKSVKHFKSVIRQKLYGKKNDLELGFLSVIETVSWDKEHKKYLNIGGHLHILFTDVRHDVNLKTDFETFLIDTWMGLKESGKRDEQQVKLMYGYDFNKCGESYITKLMNTGQSDRNNYKEWFDDGNWNKTKLNFDECYIEFIEKHSSEIYKHRYS